MDQHFILPNQRVCCPCLPFNVHQMALRLKPSRSPGWQTRAKLRLPRSARRKEAVCGSIGRCFRTAGVFFPRCESFSLCSAAAGTVCQRRTHRYLSEHVRHSRILLCGNSAWTNGSFQMCQLKFATVGFSFPIFFSKQVCVPNPIWSVHFPVIFQPLSECLK